MRKLFGIGVLATLLSYGQVGINTTNPKAILTIGKDGNESSIAINNGMLLPKLTLTEKEILENKIQALLATESEDDDLDQDDLNGLTFYVYDEETNKGELWYYDDGTKRLEPVRYNPKSFVKGVLSADALAGNDEQPIRFDSEDLDLNDEFGIVGTETSGVPPSTTNLYGFIPKRDGIYEFFVQYHTNGAISSGNYGVHVYKTNEGDTYPDNKQIVASADFAFPGGNALNKVKRSVSTIIELKQGDIVDFYWSSTLGVSGGTLSSNNAETFVTIKELRIH